MDQNRDYLTSCQKNALEEIEKFLISNYNVMFISGLAGTGKSTIVNELLKYDDRYSGRAILREVNEIRKMVSPEKLPLKDFILRASTHAAANSLEDSVRENDSTIFVKTAHSTFPTDFKTGRVTNRCISVSKANYDSGDIFIIDEFSFLDPLHIMDIIQIIVSIDAKVIFLGDKYQLSVHQKSFNFIDDHEEINKAEGKDIIYPTTYLKTFVRNEDEEVSNYVLDIINSIDSKISFKGIPNIDKFKIISPVEFRSYIENDNDETLPYPIVSEKFFNMGFISFSNNGVIRMYDEFRKSVSDVDYPPGYLIEECFKYSPIVYRSKYGHKSIGFFRNKEVDTTHAYHKSFQLLNPEDQNIIKFSIPIFNINVGTQEYPYSVINAPFPADVSKVVEALETPYLKKNKDVRNNFLKEFMPLMPQNFKTIHSSQGSTFNKVFIDLDSIIHSPNSSENTFAKYMEDELILKLLYVSITRSRGEVVFISSKDKGELLI